LPAAGGFVTLDAPSRGPDEKGSEHHADHAAPINVQFLLARSGTVAARRLFAIF